MVKTLVLVRHGSPEDVAASGLDEDRRLTPAGVRALAAAYPRTFALLGEDPELEVWSSPAVRALETAQAVCDATGAQDVAVHQSLYRQDLAAFLAELADAKAPVVVAVGHVPFMDMAAAQLTGCGLTFGKGAAMAIDLPDGPSGRGRVKWFVSGPDPIAWDAPAVAEGEVAQMAAELKDLFAQLRERPDDPVALRAFRVGLRRLRSLLEFLAPWQAKKQNRRSVRLMKELQEATGSLRGLDILCECVDGLVESGELAAGSLLPMACAKERALAREGVAELLRKEHAARRLDELEADLATFAWKGRVLESGLSASDFKTHFDQELAQVDEALFGLDLSDQDAVFRARRDAKEVHFVSERLAEVLGDERAQASEYMDSIQAELGALSDALVNERLAKDLSKSPRFRGVRADLGVVARDQSEVVSAILSGLQRLEQGGRASE